MFFTLYTEQRKLLSKTKKKKTRIFLTPVKVFQSSCSGVIEKKIIENPELEGTFKDHQIQSAVCTGQPWRLRVPSYPWDFSNFVTSNIYSNFSCMLWFFLLFFYFLLFFPFLFKKVNCYFPTSFYSYLFLLIGGIGEVKPKGEVNNFWIPVPLTFLTPKQEG